MIFIAWLNMLAQCGSTVNQIHDGTYAVSYIFKILKRVLIGQIYKHVAMMQAIKSDLCQTLFFPTKVSKKKTEAIQLARLVQPISVPLQLFLSVISTCAYSTSSIIQIPDYPNPRLSDLGLDLLRMRARNSMCQLWRNMQQSQEKEGFYVKKMKVGDYENLSQETLCMNTVSLGSVFTPSILHAHTPRTLKWCARAVC